MRSMKSLCYVCNMSLPAGITIGAVIAVYCSDIIVSIEIILRLTCFCREWCEWYDLNVM
jgi:hypothetical protein